MEDVFTDLHELELRLREQARQLQHTAAGMRDAAREHDGRALGLLDAAERLSEIERPQ